MKNGPRVVLCARVQPEMQKEMGAVAGLNYGWEHPLWFADALMW